MLGTLERLPVINWRKEETTSSQYGPYAWGYTRATMAVTKGCKLARASKSQKDGLSSDRGLQLAPVKSESLVTVDQLRYREYVPGSCKHCPSSHLSREHPKSTIQPAREEVA